MGHGSTLVSRPGGYHVFRRIFVFSGCLRCAVLLADPVVRQKGNFHLFGISLSQRMSRRGRRSFGRYHGIV